MVQEEPGFVGFGGFVEQGQECVFRHKVRAFLMLALVTGVWLLLNGIRLSVRPLPDFVHEVYDSPDEFSLVGVVLVVEIFGKLLNGVEIYVEEFGGGVVSVPSRLYVLPAVFDGRTVEDYGADFRSAVVVPQILLDAVEDFLRLDVIGVENPLSSRRKLVDCIYYVFCVCLRHSRANLHI